MAKLPHWTSPAATVVIASTVEDVAAFFDRSPVTVRGWIRGGRLRAYRFRGREYRITESAVEEFRQRQRGDGQQ